VDLLESKRKPVPCVRLGKSGENKALENIANGLQFTLGIHFEYTTRRTPQQNSLAKREFATILFRAKTIMHATHLSDYWKYFLRIEVVMLASMMHGLKWWREQDRFIQGTSNIRERRPIG